MIKDLVNNTINLWDVVLVVSAHGELQLALVTDIVPEYYGPNVHYHPLIRRFNPDGTLKHREHAFKDKWERFKLPLDAVPVDYLLTRKAMIDAKGK